MSLLSDTTSVVVPGVSFTWRMNLPAPCNKRAGSGSAAPWKNPTFTCEVNILTYPKGASPKHATGQPSCKSSRTSSPHFRITSNHCCATDPNRPACSFIHASTAGSRTTAPLNRSNSVLIVGPLSLSDLCYVAQHQEQNGHVTGCRGWP